MCERWRMWRPHTHLSVYRQRTFVTVVVSLLMGFGADAPLTSTLDDSSFISAAFLLNKGDDNVDLLAEGITEKPCTTWLQVRASSSNSGSLMIVRILVDIVVVRGGWGLGVGEMNNCFERVVKSTGMTPRFSNQSVFIIYNTSSHVEGL
jgi:hypothetical protein